MTSSPQKKQKGNCSKWLSILKRLFAIVIFIISPTILWMIFSGFTRTFTSFQESYYINGQLILYATAIMSKAFLTTYDKQISVNFGIVLGVLFYLIIISSYAMVLCLNSLKITPDADFNCYWSWAALGVSIICLAFSLSANHQSPDVQGSYQNAQQTIIEQIHE